MLKYCDYIAHLIKNNMFGADTLNIIAEVTPVQYDLDYFGVLNSTKKTLFAVDQNGTRYKITVEESA